MTTKQEFRHDWTEEEISEIYHSPLLDLVYRASTAHRKYHPASEVQVCTLLSIKTGGCSEDCSYCPQSARYNTDVKAEKILPTDVVLESASRAKASGSTRFCMGAAWSKVRDNKEFDEVIGMVKGVANMGLEVCCTLGMLNETQAKRLKDAGLHAYNHNLDTSEEKYSEIITTRSYQDRLDTIENVAKYKINVCSGGIIGLGETDDDRVKMIRTLANLSVHPESVPVNALVPVAGTPMENNEPVEVFSMVRMIATARIVIPTAKVRLSAGRNQMSNVEQAFCFAAGANAIFAGEKLLTTPLPGNDKDKEMFALLGLTPMASNPVPDMACQGEK